MDIMRVWVRWVGLSVLAVLLYGLDTGDWLPCFTITIFIVAFTLLCSRLLGRP